MVYMKPLKGKTSDRIRSGEIPEEAVSVKRIEADDRPDPKIVKHGSGHGLGSGSTSKRSGKGAES